MQQLTEAKIKELIAGDERMMRILRAVRELNLPDWWIGAGFVRGKLWDTLHGFKERTAVGDIDVVYLDLADISEAVDKRYENKLRNKILGEDWSVVNQARTHVWHGDAPYKNTLDAISRWVETPTCVAVTLDRDGQLRLYSTFGWDDLTNLVVRKNPVASDEEYENRMRKKDWTAKWPKLKIIY